MANPRATVTVATVIKIFIFEDSWMCREALVARVGQEANLQIVGAVATRAKGWVVLSTAKPDVVLMDLRFGQEVQGIAATRQVKALLPDAQVIIFTDFPQDTDLEEAIQAGDGILLKQEVQGPRPARCRDSYRVPGRGLSNADHRYSGAAKNKNYSTIAARSSSRFDPARS